MELHQMMEVGESWLFYKALVWGSSLQGRGCEPWLAAPRMDAHPCK